MTHSKQTMTTREPKSKIKAVRQSLRKKGYTQETAAKAIQRTRHHVCLVLNGHRTSTGLLAKLADLPDLTTTIKEGGAK